MASASKTKISFWERFSYGCGDLGCNIIYSAMSAFLLFYYTDYVHVSAATIGTIRLLSRVFDGVTDLIMGVIVDRTKSRFGKCPSVDSAHGNSLCPCRNPAVLRAVRTGGDLKTGVHLYYV